MFLFSGNIERLIQLMTRPTRPVSVGFIFFEAMFQRKPLDLRQLTETFTRQYPISLPANFADLWPEITSEGLCGVTATRQNRPKRQENCPCGQILSHSKDVERGRIRLHFPNRRYPTFFELSRRPHWSERVCADYAIPAATPFGLPRC